MINLKFEREFLIFVNKVEKSNLKWALTGSYRLYLENPEIVAPNDIDVITDYKGAKSISKLFHEYILLGFKFSENKTLKSYYGQLIINGVVFDVMSNVKNKINENWVDIPNLKKIDYIHFGNQILPVLPLEIEYDIAKKLRQNSKLNILQLLIKREF